MNKQLLISSGIDYDDGLRRLMGNTDLYEMILTQFLRDTVMPRARLCHESKDGSGLFEAAHELKGACGSASITTVYQASSDLVELLRRGEYDEAKVDEAFAALEAAYERAAEGIRNAI